MIQAASPPVTLSTCSFSTCPFSRIVGQRRAVPFLKEIRDGIRLGAQPHPLLFLGRSGHGKTSLSKAFADSIGAEFVRIDCGPELKSEHIVEKLTSLQTLTVVFCDEFQSMRKRVQEVLYSAIDSNLVPKLEQGRLDRCAAQVPIMPFVLIGATNEPGRLLPALRNRMVNVVMDEYTADDLEAIVLQKSRRFLLNLSDRAVGLVVRASGGSPRNIVQILQSVEVTSASWRFRCDVGDESVAALDDDVTDVVDDLVGEPLAPTSCHADSQCEESLSHDARDDGGAMHGGRTLRRTPTVQQIPDEFVERALSWMGLDLAGLDATNRTILATIGVHKRATAELLATVLGLDIAYTRENLAELRARHLVHAAPGRGWVLTDSGTKLAQELGLTA